MGSLPRISISERHTCGTRQMQYKYAFFQVEKIVKLWIPLGYEVHLKSCVIILFIVKQKICNVHGCFLSCWCPSLITLTHIAWETHYPEYVLNGVCPKIWQINLASSLLKPWLCICMCQYRFQFDKQFRQFVQCIVFWSNSRIVNLNSHCSICNWAAQIFCLCFYLPAALWKCGLFYYWHFNKSFAPAKLRQSHWVLPDCINHPGRKYQH